MGALLDSTVRLIAATAIAAGWRVATANIRQFDRVYGLEVLLVPSSGA